MTIEYVNGAVNFNEAAGSTIAAPATNHTAGNLLVVFVSSKNGDGTDVTAIADTAGNTYTRITGIVSRYAGWSEIEMWYAKNITGNANNIVTVTFNASYTNRGIQVLQYSGCDPTAPLDQSAVGEDFTATPATANITTTQADEVLVAADSLYTVKTHTPGANYTIRTQLSGAEPSWGDSEDRIVASTGDYNASYTLDSSTVWSMCLASFKAAAAEGFQAAWAKNSNQIIQGVYQS